MFLVKCEIDSAFGYNEALYLTCRVGAGYIRAMATFSEALRTGIKRTFCQVISATDRATALIRQKVVGDVLDDVSFPALVNRWVCDRDMPNTPPPPSFTGGQCSDLLYHVVIEYSCGDGFVNTAGYDNYPGPIESYSATQDRVWFTYGGGQERTVATGFCEPGWRVVSFTVDAYGQPDDCGDPDSVLPSLPPGWNQASDNITYTNSDGVDVTVPIVAAFGYASLNVNADVTIPVSVDLGGITFDVDFNLNTGDIQLFPTNNNDYGDRRRGTKPVDVLPPPGEDIPPPPQGLPPPPPPIDEGGPESERVIVAAVVSVLDFESGSVGTLFQSDNPDISIPNFGHISFLCRVGPVSGAWTHDIPVKNRQNIIPCPIEWGAFDVKGTPRAGISWQITPLYSKKESPILYPVS